MEMMTYGGSTKLATHKEKCQQRFRQSSLSLPMSMANRFAFAKLRKISSGGRVMLLSMVCPLELPSSRTPSAIVDVVCANARTRDPARPIRTRAQSTNG